MTDEMHESGTVLTDSRGRAARRFRRRPRRRLPGIAAALGVLLFASAMPLAPQSANADTAPPVAGTPETVSSDPLPAPQIDGVVWDQVVIGGVVYVGGDFSTARPAGAAEGTATVARMNILAYDLTTGVLITTFAPAFNAPIRALAASSDGKRLYAGGSFTSVSGTTRYRIAALDVTSGALVASFNPSINSSVRAIAVTGSTVYIGGHFSSVQNQPRSRVAALSASNAQLLPFAPNAVGGDVSAIVVAPSGSEVVMGGAFTSVNGSNRPGYGLAAVDPVTGSLRPFAVNSVVRNAGVAASITSLAADSTGVYGTGYVYGGGGNFEGSFKAGWNGGAIRWLEDCHGDSYSITAAGTTAYVAGHPHYCGNISTGGFPDKVKPSYYYRALAFTTSPTGTLTSNMSGSYASFTGQPAPSLQHWFPDFNAGTFTGATQGPWDVTAAGGYVLYGGEFTKVNGTPQQGLVRFATKAVAPNKDGPRLSGATMKPTVQAAGSGAALISWTANYDRDNSDLRYEVIRDGNTAKPVATARATSNFWTQPRLTVTDTGLTAGRTYGYRIRTIDPFGNVTTGDTVSFTPSAGARTGGAPPAAPSGTTPSGTIPSGTTPPQTTPPEPAAPPDEGAGNAAPTAKITSQVDGLIVTSSAAGSTDADGTVVAAAWTLGDGSTAQGISVSHTYPAAGSYPVTLTVTDEAGATSTATATVTVVVTAPG